MDGAGGDELEGVPPGELLWVRARVHTAAVSSGCCISASATLLPSLISQSGGQPASSCPPGGRVSARACTSGLAGLAGSLTSLTSSALISAAACLASNARTGSNQPHPRSAAATAGEDSMLCVRAAGAMCALAQQRRAPPGPEAGTREATARKCWRDFARA